jgi:ATP-dependent helicase HrpB
MTVLPIDNFLPQIVVALRDRGTLVLVAEPGAGKTTRVPPAILDAGLLEGANPKLIMLQPRRVAARASAARIADERGFALGGDDVGYHVRFDKRVTDRTRLRVVTEGILTRQLVSDPFLEGIGCVVLDEFHERSLDVDLAIALLREVRQSVRPDLKLVVMSATLDAESVATFLGDDRGPAPIVKVPGRTFPVEVEYRQPTERKIWDRAAEEVEKVLDLVSLPGVPGRGQGEGREISSPLVTTELHAALLTSPSRTGERDQKDVLVFLPGAFEIMRAEHALTSVTERFDVDVRPLHGSLSFEDQQLALQPSARRKVILATNIAETSLTIDGVTHVIDSGLARVPRFDPRRGLDRLELTRISQASATQRAGRAGRTGPGRCVRLWTSREQAALDAFETPEIRRVDLAPTVLSLRAWGTADPRSFGWFDAPDEATLVNAEKLLAMLGAIDGERGTITPLGKHLARLPVHPRIGRMLLAGVAWNVTELACSYAAILSEKDFVRDDDAWANRAPRTVGASDLAWRAQLLEGNAHEGFIDRNGHRSVRRVRDELLRVARRIHVHQADTPALSPIERENVELLLPLLGYPDRVCKRRDGDTTAGTMVGGGGVRLHVSSVAREGAFFLALDARSDERSRTREAQVRIASRIEPEWLERFMPGGVRIERNVELDEPSGRVFARRRVIYRDLTLGESRSGGADVDADDARHALADALAPRWAEMFDRSESLRPLAKRRAMLAKHLPAHLRAKVDESNPSTSETYLVVEACTGARSIDDVVRKLPGVVESQMSYAQRRELDEYAPESITVPTGSAIKLDWLTANAGDDGTPVRGPVMAVRLQELFGLADTPRVCGGTIKVVLHLLGPNYKPVQVTDDLASFWKNTYVQVRKDLRARYPKHSWPDDPLTAPAMRGPRRRGER